ncbi:MAG: pirin family protein, partial [Gammaproteobacteria bacterium]
NGRQVLRVVKGHATSDGAGVHLTRLLGTNELSYLDPFLLLDEIRSDDPSDYIAGFPDHPHRGFETVTYMLAGRMRHRDNKGNSGLLGPGSVQWMTAGRGIVHSELPEQEDGLMWGFQLWVNLPASEKLSEPRYQDISAQEIPEVTPEFGVRARIVAGQFGGATGPVQGVSTDPIFLDLMFDADKSVLVPLPKEYNAFVYVYEGSLRVGSRPLPVERDQLAVLSSGSHIDLGGGAGGGRIILVAGRPCNEPVARYGPFVMNTEEEIHQAFNDYQAGRF